MRVGGRYLARDNGTLFLVHAGTARRAVMRFTLPEAEMYLNDRRARGFNTVRFILRPTFTPPVAEKAVLEP